MKTSNILTCTLFLIISLSGAILGVGYSHASDGEPDSAASGDKQPEKGTTNEKEETKSIGVELDAAFVKDQSQLPGSQPDKATSNDKDAASDVAGKDKEGKLEAIDMAQEVPSMEDSGHPSHGKSDETAGDDKGTVSSSSVLAEEEELESLGAEAETPLVEDPIEPYNRAIFGFNDKVYYYVIKPVYKGYNVVVPEKARVSVRNFFTNIKMPVRFFNCLFQAKYKGAGIEMSRFFINSTVGVAGFFDPAKSQFSLERQDTDFGQTLGKYNIGSGSYINWPFIGPSTVRDTVGYVGDVVLNPLSWVSYFFLVPLEGFGIGAYDTVNDVSIDKGTTYESITKPAVDPYIAVQDAYIQNRNKKLKE